MKIALIGYGKMGKTIDRLATAAGHEIVGRVNSSDDWPTNQEADVAIEFTRPESAVLNIKKALELDLPIVVGTTGWYDQFTEVEGACAESNGAIFYATNFSVGVNLFWKANRYLAQLMHQFEAYTPSIKEVHHTEKLDKPSGTAISTAQQILNSNPRYSEWSLEATPSKLQIEVERKEDVKGTHIVRYESDIDRIELAHYAKSRDGFAKGSILAAEFILGKKGVYTMADMLDF